MYHRNFALTAFQIGSLTTFLALMALIGEPRAQTSAKPLTEVDGVLITLEEVEKSLGSQLGKLEEQIYNLKRQKVDGLINDKLLEKEAAKRGISITALFDAEVTAKVTLVTEQEIENFYQANKAQVKTAEEAQAREQMRAYLQNQKIAQRRQEFIDSLRSQAKIVVNLQEPPVLRADVKIDGAPFKGGKNAPVTIVEFTDVHCPFCQRVLPTLTQLLSRPSDLKTYAKDVGIELAAFDACVGSGKYQAAVEKDIDEGRRAGVTGTPASFINGRLIAGAQPLENFVRVIDEELTRSK